MRKLFATLRKIDKFILAILNRPAEFRPRQLNLDFISLESLGAVVEYDRSMFREYAKSSKSLILHTVYRFVRNKIFVSLYKIFKKIAR